jgi:hypothetical protein
MIALYVECHYELRQRRKHVEDQDTARGVAPAIDPSAKHDMVRGQVDHDHPTKESRQTSLRQTQSS